MVRTKTKKTTKAAKRKTGAEGGSDAARMSNLADLALSEERAAVVTQFAEKTNSGDGNSLDTLDGLKNPIPTGDAPGANRIGFSQALAWRAEPEWQGEASEAEAETAIGSREPES